MSRTDPDPTSARPVGMVAAVERPEWEESGEADAALGFAPLPPLHERTWRHPSELGASSTLPIPPSPSLSRAVVISTALVAVACAVAFGLLLLPDSGSEVVGGPSTTDEGTAATALTFAALSGDAWMGVQSAAAASGGAAVTRVMSGSPAADAGVQAGDVIVTVGESAVGDPDDLAACLREYRPGATVALVVHRSGAPLELEVVLTAAPPD